MKISKDENSKPSFWKINPMKDLFFILILLSTFALSSCDGNDGGGDDDGGSSSDDGPIVDSSGILQNLRTANLNSNTFPWNQVPDYAEGCDLVSLTDGKIKRWDIEGQGPIPVKIGSGLLVTQALNLVEEKLGMTLFDRTSLINVPIDDIERGIIFASEEEAQSYNVGFDNSYGCGDVSFNYEIGDGFFEDIELEYDSDGNIIGYNYPVLGQAYNADGNPVGNIMDGSRYIFDDNNMVIGILAEEDWLLYDANGNAICTLFSDNAPLFDENGIAIGAVVVVDNGGYFYISGTGAIESGYYDAAGRINGSILVRLDNVNCSFSDSEDEVEVIVNKLGRALGLVSNFNGYGDNSNNNFSVNENFWNVLNTLYRNPIGTEENSVEIYSIL